MLNRQRPVNLDLARLSYPPMAIVSILHRISGLVLFLFLPVVLYFFGLSLQSSASFFDAHTLLAKPLGAFFLWAFGSALLFHVLAGVRHLMMDLGFGESLVAGRRSSVVVLVLAVGLSLGLGAFLW